MLKTELNESCACDYISHLSMRKIRLDFPFASHLMKDCSNYNPMLQLKLFWSEELKSS